MLRVWGAVVWHLPSILRNRWAALTARVSRSTISCMNARLTRALLAGTDCIHSNSYTKNIGQHGARRWTNNADRRQLSKRKRRSFATRKTLNIRPVGDIMPPCCPPHGNNMCFNSVSQRSRLKTGCCSVLWSPWRRPTTYIADRGRPPTPPWRSAM